MKNIVTYIKEEYKKKYVYNVKVIFDIIPDEFYLTAPETYSESDIQIYIGDVLLNELPADNDKYKYFFGKNINSIIDVYFEYEKFEHIQDSDINKVNIEWDSYYDDKIKEPKLDIYKLTNLKYIILFDNFEILDDTDDYKTILNNIFSKLDSSNINKYPIEIKYNPNNLEFEE